MSGAKTMNIYGNLYISGLLYGTHAFFSSNVRAVSYIATGDQSVKDDIKDVDLTPIFDKCNVIFVIEPTNQN